MLVPRRARSWRILGGVGGQRAGLGSSGETPRRVVTTFPYVLKR